MTQQQHLAAIKPMSCQLWIGMGSVLVRYSGRGEGCARAGCDQERARRLALILA